MLPQFSYVRARSLSDAFEQSRSSGAVLFAGGTDLLGCLRDGVFPASKLVAIGGLDEMHGINETRGGGLRIGAITTLAEISGHPLVIDRYAVLAQGAAAAASPQLRNQGTLGGNLCQRPRCWYYRGEFNCLRKGGNTCYAVVGENQYHCILGGSGCYFVHPSDTAPALTALEAKVRLASPSGSRLVSLGSFFVPPDVSLTRETDLRPGEILTEVLLPAATVGQRSIYRKVRSRGTWDFALAGVAATLTFAGDRVERARIVLSGVAPIPWRAGDAEDVITGSGLDAETISRAAEACVSGALPLSQNRYKVELVRGLTEETLHTLADR